MGAADSKLGSPEALTDVIETINARRSAEELEPCLERLQNLSVAGPMLKPPVGESSLTDILLQRNLYQSGPADYGALDATTTADLLSLYQEWQRLTAAKVSKNQEEIGFKIDAVEAVAMKLLQRLNYSASVMKTSAVHLQEVQYLKVEVREMKRALLANLPSCHDASKPSIVTVVRKRNSLEAMASRQRFYVELKKGETTVVSWKQLESSAKRELELGMLSNVSANSHSALEAPIALDPAAAPVVKDPIHQIPNRLTSVIEKIERLFQGEDSDNDDVDDGPAKDRYDTDDSFIDDEELDKYFVKDKVKTKHSGFFINRGALEKISEPSPIEAVQLPKKKRAESKKNKARVLPSPSSPSSPLEVVVRKERKRKEPGMRKKREPNGSKKNLAQEQEQGKCQNLETEVVESKKRKRKEPTGMRKEPKRNKKNPVQEKDQEPCQNLKIAEKIEDNGPIFL